MCRLSLHAFLLLAPSSVLLPVLQAKAKRGPPRQAKYAIHCINAMFSNRDTHFAQIFEVSQMKSVKHEMKITCCKTLDLFLSEGLQIS